MLNLEKRSEKIAIRQHLLGQFFEFAKSHNEVSINSLPAEGWKFEESLVNLVNAIYPEKSFNLNCFDWDNDFRIHFPYDYKLNMFDNKQTVKTAKVGNVSITGSYGFNFQYAHAENYDIPTFSWADYCGMPSAEIVQDFSAAIRAGDVIYITLNRTLRCPKAIDPVLAKLSNSHSVADAIVMRLENIIRRQLGKNFTRIYECVYIGGKRASMITVGWHFVKNSSIKPLNFQWHTPKVIEKAAHVEPVQALLKSGVADAEIFKQFPALTTMQLAGAKAAIKRAENKAKA